MPIGIKNINYESCLYRTAQAYVSEPLKKAESIVVNLTSKPDVFKPTISDLLKLPAENILSVAKETIKKNEPFHFGAESVVYKIPETQYALLVPHGKTIGNYASVSFDLTDKERINHFVAKLGSKIYLKKFIEGLTTKAPYIEKATPFGMISVADEAAQKKVNEHVKNLTPESFENLYNQIFKAMNNDLTYDCFGENLILNPKTKTLTAIDFDTMQTGYKFNPVAEIYHSFSLIEEKEQKVLLDKIIAGFLNSVTDKHCALKDFSQLKIAIASDEYNLFKEFEDKSYLTKLNGTLSEILTDFKLLRHNNT